jgi:hypothetical protein
LNYLDLTTPNGRKNESYFMDALVDLYQKNGIEFGNPWQHKIQYRTDYIDLDTTFSDSSGFSVDYHFQIARSANLAALDNIKLVVERPELWSVSINDSLVEKEDGKYWIDLDYPKFEIGPYIRHGRNTITLTAERMSIFAEIMPVYILGGFILRPLEQGFEIRNGELEGLGSWQDAGHPFYSGKVSYSQGFNIEKRSDRFKVRLTGWNGTVAEVMVNGTKAGIIAWPPEELEITSLLRDGENDITIRVVGSLKNTFGYFYADNQKWINGPHDWDHAPEDLPGMDQYYLMDYGLFNPFELWKTSN